MGELSRIALVVTIACACTLFRPHVSSAETVFPNASWAHRDPAELNVDAAALDQVAHALSGRGCVIKDGWVVKEWGDQAEVCDWLSSAKPVLSTLLFFAVEEGLVKDVDQPIADFEWGLRPRHRGITFRHLGAMSSGYARPEGAGEAWAYNDFAIQLYQKTLFDKVYKTHGNNVAWTPLRLGALGFRDGPKFSNKHRLKASVRDFARIAWFWCHEGNWNGRQVLPKRYFNEYMRHQTPEDLPQTARTGTDDDYLGIGSYGGGSDHFSEAGPGIYGFNWWFNDTGRLHPDAVTWPDAPRDTVMSIGARGNCAAFVPSLNAALICADGDWGKVAGGDRDAKMNQVLKRFATACGYRSPSIGISGDLAKWAPVTIDFHGPFSEASGTDPNPFLDFRLQVGFVSPSGQTFDVPGFFAGDGNGALAGDVWQVVFSPDEIGQWRFTASFRAGTNVAVSLDPNEGEPAAFDGMAGRFLVSPHSSEAPGFYRWGRLEYVGDHYLKFRDGPYWLKGGTDSPEDLLAYTGFLNTPGRKHAYAAHVRDWNDGDPSWDDGQGKGIIGALNYLASMDVNSIYFLVMNIGGDGKNVSPYLNPIVREGSPDNDNVHLDLAKLRQWDIVFRHAQRLGIMLHIVLNEAEEPNKRELDNGGLGTERKLYYRELAARFGHYPALQWNLCEEYNLKLKLDPGLVREFAQYLRSVDPYRHPITVHHAGNVSNAWTPFLGDSLFTVTSFQVNKKVSHVVETWRAKSKAAGVPLVIGMDEFFPDKTHDANVDRHRREYLWPVYLSGGQIEFILEELLKVEDFRNYERLWEFMAHARRFMEENLPFWEMQPADDLLTGESEFTGKNSIVAGQVFAKAGECYAVYLPVAEQTGLLDLTNASGTFVMRWFNPRSGAFEGAASSLEGDKQIPLGPPPADASEDWVVLLGRQ
ncbi:MAG: DUF5060 domain-containing protein [bacterium]|nr:DUF5060 domain-containing protein [bacterium]